VLENKNKQFVEQISQSRIFQDYERAFSEATGLPLSLRPLEAWQVPHRGKKHQNPFCSLMAQHSRTCAACLEVQEKLTEDKGQAEKTTTCFAGLQDTAVPIRLGSQLAGFLVTGQIRVKQPTRSQFQRVTQQLLKWGLEVDLGKLEDVYFHTRVLTPKQYESMVRLLTIFAQHLSVVGNQMLVQQRNAEPPAIVKARQFIKEHQSDDLSLSTVAKAVNTSTFYFCKMFKKATGLNFTDYLSRVRIEKAKNLLLNPNARVSEVAYEVGFQSLTHFNRVFKRVTGVSPTAYREKLPAQCPGLAGNK
jgi:AraC-like DNA-binding protein/ligand-binding sensor protein